MHPNALKDPRAGESAERIRHSRGAVPKSKLNLNPVQNQNITGTDIGTDGAYNCPTRANIDRQSKPHSNKDRHASIQA